MSPAAVKRWGGYLKWRASQGGSQRKQHYGKIVQSKLADWPKDTMFVTYCAGPHCNGAARGAIRLAKLGRPVKIMAGGVTGWIDEGFDLEGTAG